MLSNRAEELHFVRTMLAGILYPILQVVPFSQHSLVLGLLEEIARYVETLPAICLFHLV